MVKFNILHRGIRVLCFDKLYLGGDSGGSAPITIARGASDDEPVDGTTRASNSINIGKGTGVYMIDDFGHINIGDKSGSWSKGGSSIYGQNVNIGYYSGLYTDGLGNVNIGSTTSHHMEGNWNVFLGGDAGIYTSGDYNSIVGYGGSNYMIGNYNAGVGYSNHLRAIGNFNSTLGYSNLLDSNTSYTVAIGYSTAVSMHSTSGSVVIGRGAGTYTSGDWNTILGGDSGSGVSGDNNLCVGKGMGSYTQGQDNIYIGRDGMYSLSGSLNIAMGVGVSTPVTPSPKRKREKCILLGPYTAEVVDADIINAVAIGDHVCASVSSMDRVVGIGTDTLNNATNTTDVVAIGTSAGYYGNHPYSVMIGYNAGADGDDVIGDIVAIGYESGYKSNTYRTVMIGNGAGANSQMGLSVGTYIGYEAGRYGQMGDCIAIGEQAGYGASAVDSLFIGEYAGRNSTGNNCVFIGENAGENNTENNKFAITNASNILLSGDFSTGEVIVDHMKFPKTNEPTVVAGHAYMFASASGAFGTETELYVEDSSSNITKISPHNDNGEWEVFFFVIERQEKQLKLIWRNSSVKWKNLPVKLL